MQLFAKLNLGNYCIVWRHNIMIDKIKDAYDKITMVVMIPLGLGFVVLAVFGQLCLDNLPYLTC